MSTILHFEHSVHESIKGTAFVDIEEAGGDAGGQPSGNPESVSYRYRGKLVETVWTGGEVRPFLVRQMRTELRLVMGFWAQPGISIMKKAVLCGFKDSGEYIDLNRKLMTDPDFRAIGAVQHCLQHGLPRSAAVQMRGVITCDNCGANTSILPCIHCWDGWDDDQASIDNGDQEKCESSPDDYWTNPQERKFEATDAMPGTDEKLAVLIARQRTGLPLWHPDDPVVEHGKAKRWWAHM